QFFLAELYPRRILLGIINANLLNIPSVARRTRVGNNDTIKWALLAAMAREANCGGHNFQYSFVLGWAINIRRSKFSMTETMRRTAPHHFCHLFHGFF